MEHAITKVEEIEALEALVNHWKNKDAYLSGLFTDEFLKWATYQIRADFCVDLYAEYKKAVAAVAKKNKDIEDKDNIIGGLQYEIEGLQKRLATKEIEIIKLKARLWDILYL